MYGGGDRSANRAALDIARSHKLLRLANTGGVACARYASRVASATASRHPCANSGRFTYSFTVWISYCPLPIVTVGTPCLTNQLASRPPLEKTVEGFRPSDSAARLAYCTTASSS